MLYLAAKPIRLSQFCECAADDLRASTRVLFGKEIGNTFPTENLTTGLYSKAFRITNLSLSFHVEADLLSHFICAL